ncbi:hypothetical protein ZYGR_0H01080 [Zygosaccharomyces rouxii]|uniref:ZYRO0B06424p n=2 Tax=Zygosaccharomyces rouxii TaxID=4956 RepID=C5DR88_ZYGRC|nr:uncharacterized protein ZYRO0B06424g [Zygosaccharomyces rouxii]KAH9200156.1 hypothetical protein LQ764DRAFT_178763 [Zygosaccharomyces rouxii]GAV47267.1 hypothetical protein ZYGR_0H01080 [Zygosaccharomyces rouxii]CAR26299.1 ZYRO0B06424p [Zygosaccharomyces rouxii]
MDKLQELEEKKRQLRELRERRQNHGGIISNLLQQSVQSPVMVSASVQTDEVGTIKSEPQTVHREVITYDKSIQVDLPQESAAEQDSIAINVPETIDESTQEDDKEADDQPKNESVLQPQLKYLEPLVVEDQSNTVHDKSFSIFEILQESHGSHTFDGGSAQPNTGDPFEHVVEWDSTLTCPEGGRLICVSLDHYKDLIVALFRSEPVAKFNKMAATWSHVRVFKWDTGQMVDSIDFRGQTLLWAKFLRRNTSSNVVPILITTYTGKTILCELRCVGNTQNKRMERNLIIKNYHAHPIYAFDEYKNVAQGKERFLVASSNGIINELSPWNLSPYKDATSNTQQLWETVVEPPKASEIYNLNHDDDDDDSIEDMVKEDLHQQCFTDHLLRVSLYDELAITSLAICPSNQEQIYVGTEDGGIYKLELSNLTTKNSLVIHQSNHGFIPNTMAPAFHSSHVVSLHFDQNELLLSASLDWTCCLWDPKNNCKLGQFDVGTPIISTEWLDGNKCAILTSQALLIVSWHITISLDHRTRIKTYKCTSPPQLEHTFNNPKGNFTCFKTFPAKGSSTLLVLGSSDDTRVQFYRLKNPQTQ